jgi:hypothetical protein
MKRKTKTLKQLTHESVVADKAVLNALKRFNRVHSSLSPQSGLITRASYALHKACVRRRQIHWKLIDRVFPTVRP